MQHEHHALKPYGIDGSIRTLIPILDNLQDASRAEALEGLGLPVLLAILGKVKSISKKVHHRLGQGK
jgi:molecular chaperone GrpE (heat shock protein)